MGLLIHAAFETKEGILVTSVYSRILSVACEFRGPNVNLTLVHETYLNREKRIQKYSPLFATVFEYRIHVEVPQNAPWGTMKFLYQKLKDRLAESQIVAEDVLEVEPEIVVDVIPSSEASAAEPSA